MSLFGWLFKMESPSRPKGHKSDGLDRKAYADQITMIKEDLVYENSKNKEDKKSKMAAIEMLKALMLSGHDNVQLDVVNFIKEIKEEWIKKEIYECIEEYTVHIICDCNVKEFEKLFSLWKNFYYDKFVEIVKPAVEKAEGENVNKLILKFIFPSKQNKVPAFKAIEIARFLSNFVISEPSKTELNTLVSHLPSRIQEIKEDRELLENFIIFLLEYVKLQIFNSKLEKTLDVILSSESSKNIFVNHVKTNLLIKIIQSENHLEYMEALYSKWQKSDLPLFGEVIKEVIKKKSNILICKTFYLDSLIHTIMQPPSSKMSLDTRDVLTELAYEFAAYLPITWWLAEEYDKFLKNVTGDPGYIKNISALYESKYQNWHKLWMFLVRILGKKLHKNIDLNNKMLRIVEKGFKSTDCSERLKSYECWKELIDSWALDKNQITNSKQIKLLLTPLRAKFSKQGSVISKRFDIFVHFIEKLQSNAVLVIKDFLEFCFGAVGENTDPNKSGGGKIVPELWSKSAKVLMAFVGHSHREKDECLGSEEVIKLHNRIITQNNIASHYYHILNSVAECSKLLKDVEFDSIRHTVLDCLWRSTMNTILSSQSDKRPQFLELFGKILVDLLQEENSYNNTIASVIFKVAMGMDPGKTTDFIIDNLNHILKIVFTVPMQEENSSVEVEKLCLILFNTQKSEKLSQIKKDVFNAYKTFKTYEKNASFVAEVWVNLASELEGYGKGKSLDYLLWPALHLHHLEPNGKIRIDLIESYRALVSCHIEKQKDAHVGLFSSYKKLLKHNPLLANNIMSLIELFSYNLHNLDILNHTLQVFSQILILSNTEIADYRSVNSIEGFIRKCLTSTEFSKIKDPTTVKNFLECIEFLFKDKHYDCVEDLETFIKNLPESVQFLYAKQFPTDLFMEIFHKETDAKITGTIYKIVDSLRNVKDPSVSKTKSPFPMGGRSAKIANMVRNSPQTNNAEGSPSGLRLFGKNVETLSPLNVKGSLLKNTPTKTSKNPPAPKKKNLPSIMDESTSEFVPISTEVKVQPDKLTEHQKEALKRRREDIPALYEDLSQSQSQSLNSLIALDKRTEIEEASSNNDPNLLKDKNKKSIDFSENIFTETEGNLLDEKREEPSTNDIEQVLDHETEKDGKLQDNEEEKEQDEETKKQFRMQAELRKLQMNIVGADEFFSPGRPKRMRKSLMQDKSEEKNKKNDKEKSEKIETPKNTAKVKTVLDKNKKLSKEDPNVDKKPTEEREKLKTLDQDAKTPSHTVESLSAQTQTPPPDKTSEVITQPDMFKDESQVEEKASSKLDQAVQNPLPEHTPNQDKIPKKRGRKSNAEKALLAQKSSETLGNDSNIVPLKKINIDLRKSARKSHGASESPKASKKPPEGGIVSNVAKEITFTEKGEPSVQEPTVNDEYFSPSNNVTKRRKNFNGKPIKKNFAEIEEEITINVEKNVSDTPGNILSESRDSGRKRPLPESDEEDDVIESSQESTTPLNTLKSRNLSRLSGLLLNGSNDSKTSRKSVIVDNEKESPMEDLIISIDRVDKMSEADNLKNSRLADSSVADRSPKSKNAKKVKESPVKVDDENASCIKKDLKVHLKVMDMMNTQDPNETNIKCKNAPGIDPQKEDIQMQDTQTQDTQTQDTQTQDTQTQDTQTQDTQTQDTQTQETESYDLNGLNEEKNSEDSAAVLQLEIPKKPDLTDSEKILSRMDTETLTETDLNRMLDSSVNTVESDNLVKENNSSYLNEIIENSEKSAGQKDQITLDPIEATKDEQFESPMRTGSLNHSSDLPSSPVTGDTPNRTNELLNSTSDISPIGSKSSSSSSLNDYPPSGIAPVVLKFDETDEDEQQSERSPEKGDDAPSKISSETSETTNQNEVESDNHTIEETMPVKAEIMEIDNHIEVIKEGKSISDRSTKLFELVKEGSVSHRAVNKHKSQGASMSPSASRIKKLMSKMKCGDLSIATGNDKKEDILTFSREVPSPLAVPRSSILKRKHCENEEGFSPLAKRKRVNFSDPCTTSQKIFIKDDNHAANIFYEQNISLHKELFGDTPNEENYMETEEVETEQSAQIVNTTMLRKDQPIYHDLVDCEADVAIIVKKVTSPMFVCNLLNKLKSRGIKTIGELANLSEAEINRYPFKTPVVTNVFKALDDYHKKNMSKSLTDSDASVVKKGGTESVQNASAGTSVDTRKTSPRKKLMLFKESEREEGIEDQLKEDDDTTIEQLCEIVILALKTKNIVEQLKGRLKLQIQDVFELNDYPEALKEIIKTLGVSEVFNILTVVIRDQPEQEEAYNNRMIQDCTKLPLEKLLENRSLDDVRKALWKCVENGRFTEQQVFTTIFLPSVNLTLLNPFFDRLTVVDLENVVLTRLKGEDFDSFARKIIEKQPFNTSEIVKRLKLEELSSEDCIELGRMVSITLAKKLPPLVFMDLYLTFLREGVSEKFK